MRFTPILFFIFSMFFSASAEEVHPSLNAINAVDIFCDPAKDYFEFTPLYFFELKEKITQNINEDFNKNKNNLDVAIKARPEFEALHGKNYGIFLNGKYVAEKEYNYSCELNSVQIHVSMNYHRAQTPATIQYWCEQDIPPEFKEFAESIRNKAAQPLCIRENNGSVTILYGEKRLAFYDYFKYDGYIKKIVFNNKNLEFCSEVLEECDKPKTLSDLIKTPVYFKSYQNPPQY